MAPDADGLLHILMYGQSLARGVAARPPITTTPLPYAYKFAGGVRADDGGANPDAIYGSLANFAETSRGIMGETPLGGCIRMLAQLLRAEGRACPSILGSAPGHNACSAAELSDGSVYLARARSNIRHGRQRAKDMGKPYALGFVAMVQGERDYRIGTPAAEWKSLIEAIRQNLEAKHRAVSGQMAGLPLLTYQTATHPYYDRDCPVIALAQNDLCTDNTAIGMAAPCYPLAFSRDHLHLTANGSLHLGAYFGLAAKQWLWDGSKPVPFRPVASRQGARLVLRFPVEAGKKLVLHEWPRLENYGLTVLDRAGNAVGIAVCSLSGSDSVDVVLSSDPGAGCRVRLGWIGDGHRGLTGFRDNSGDTLVFDPDGAALAMHRWAPIDEIVAD